MNMRWILVIVGFTCCYGLLTARLWNVQVKEGELYSVKAESQLKLASVLQPIRGNIYFSTRQGDVVPAAMNRNFPSIFAVPKEIEDTAEAVGQLRGIVARNEDELTSMLEKKDRSYAVLVQKATPEQVEAIANLHLKGVYVEENLARYYPLQKIGSHVLGFVSENGSSSGRPIGQYGAERFYEEKLAGKKGATDGDTIVRGETGDDIVLSIDRNIQDRASEIMEKLVTQYSAEGGSFIVSDPKTGKILAMGGVPAFDPNTYSSSALKTFLNPNVQEVYEPGSIFKVLTMAAGIDSGAITPETTYYDSGSLTSNGFTVRNWDKKSHGTVSMTYVIENSLNTGAAFAERKTGHAKFYEYLQKFGFKETTGIDLPGERIGSLAPLEEKNAAEINFATASYGQGISVTPIQLIRAIGAIANKGVMTRPFLSLASTASRGERVIAEETAKQVTDMMVSAVDKAQIAKIPGYRVAGKTGTAFIPNFGGKGYTDQVINTYVGFAPASNPKFIILLRLVKPAGAPLAGLTVVPAFRELAEFSLGYYNVPPDR